MLHRSRTSDPMLIDRFVEQTPESKNIRQFTNITFGIKYKNNFYFYLFTSTDFQTSVCGKNV